MLNAEIRPLGDAGDTLEEGICIGCWCSLPNLVSVRQGAPVPPSLIFIDSDRSGILTGLCPGCMDDTATLLNNR